MGFESTFVLLFAVATAVALLARWVRVPYTVALVVAGLALGSTKAFPAVHLTKPLLYSVFLPGLLFEAALQLRFSELWENKLALLVLTVPGVAAATLLTAILLTLAVGVLHLSGGFSLEQGLVFGALMAATDPIAVVGLFESLRVPRRFAVLVEGESLLNDGTAVVLLSVILAFLAGEETSLAGGALTFLAVVGFGAVLGYALGRIACGVARRAEDPMIEIALTTIAAYGSFVLAERVHVSGVIACVAAGVACGTDAGRRAAPSSTRIATEPFWEYVAFALNSIVFLLIGLEVHVDALAASWKPIVAAYLVMTLGRAAVVYSGTAFLGRTAERFPRGWSAALTWGGLRGALSMVLALGLPRDFPCRNLLVEMTFGAVVLSILIQGLTMARLLTRLGIVGPADAAGPPP